MPNEPESPILSPAERRRQKREARKAERAEKTSAAKGVRARKAAVKWALVVLVAGLLVFFIVRAAMRDSSPVTSDERFPYGKVHWHAKLRVIECGQVKDFSHLGSSTTHVGTTMLHTHGDNTIHIEGAPTRWSDITLQRFFGGINYPFSSTRLGEHENGEACPIGNPGTVTVTVDGQPAVAAVALKDKQEIVVEFG